MTKNTKRLYESEIETPITQLGNSFVIKIPREIAQLLNFRKGVGVRIYPEENKLIVERFWLNRKFYMYVYEYVYYG